MLLRSQRAFSVEDLVIQYKQQVLTFIEYRTGAIYHATKTVLKQLDVLQTRFLREFGISEAAALIDFSLAPFINAERYCFTGTVAPAAIGEGPPQLREFFKRRIGVCFYMTTKKVKTIPC